MAPEPGKEVHSNAQPSTTERGRRRSTVGSHSTTGDSGYNSPRNDGTTNLTVMEGDDEVIVYQGRLNYQRIQPELPSPGLMTTINRPSQISSRPLPSIRELGVSATAASTMRVIAHNVNNTNPLGSSLGSAALLHGTDILPSFSISASPYGMVTFDTHHRPLPIIPAGAIDLGRPFNTQGVSNAMQSGDRYIPSRTSIGPSTFGAIGSGRSSNTQLSLNDMQNGERETQPRASIDQSSFSVVGSSHFQDGAPTSTTRSEMRSTRDNSAAQEIGQQASVHRDLTHLMTSPYRPARVPTESSTSTVVAVASNNNPTKLDPTRMFVPRSHGCMASTPGEVDAQRSISNMFRMGDTEYVSEKIQEMQRVAMNNGVVLAPFRPSNSALMNIYGTDTSLAVRGGRRHTYPQPGFAPNRSGNYRGDLNIPSNQSANIDASENCATWVIGLPGDVTHRELLSAIRGVGKIYAAVINPPTERFGTAAAKIVFLNRPAAEMFMRQAANGLFIVMGTEVRNVRWNTIRSAAHHAPEQSRAIRITGPAALMDFDYFEDYFTKKFTYQLDSKGVVPCNIPGRVSHEWHFGSLRCQSIWAKRSIEQELRGIFQVVWASDPCAGVTPLVPNMWYV